MVRLGPWCPAQAKWRMHAAAEAAADPSEGAGGWAAWAGSVLYSPNCSIAVCFIAAGWRTSRACCMSGSSSRRHWHS